MRVLWPIYRLEKDYNQYPGIMSISALLKQRGHTTRVVASDPSAVSRLLEEDPQPTVLAYSTPTPCVAYYLQVNRKVKKRFPGVRALFGGPHPTFFPEMIEQDGVDGVCRGEGEYAMLEMLDAMDRGEPGSGLQNWWVKDNGQIHRNEVRPLIEDLDELPIPDHGLFEASMGGNPLQAIVMTSRGCPYRCTYCYNHVYRKIYKGKGQTVRRRGVDAVLAELRHIRESGYRFVRFMDDLFILSAPWIREFTPRYREAIGLPFSCLVRADCVTAEIASLLKQAGCYRVSMGVECGNDRVRNEILKRNMKREEILRAAGVLRSAGIKIVTQNILGIPGGSFETDWETLKLNVECRPNHASVSLLQPFPRTEIYEYAVGMGLYDGHHREGVEQSFGFGSKAAVKLGDRRATRAVQNLHDLFPLAARWPVLLPLVRLLVKLPAGAFYRLLYRCMCNYGMHFEALPPRIGTKILWRNSRFALALRRLRESGAALAPHRRGSPA